MNLADQTDVMDENGLEVNILIDGDQMYKTDTGLIAYKTGQGYVIGGPIDPLERRFKTNINFTATHVLHVPYMSLWMIKFL